MKKHFLFLSVLGIGGCLVAACAADLTGKVVLKGTPKPEITIDMTGDPKCSALHSKPVTTRHYVVGPDGGLANVIVYVKSGLTGGKSYPAPAEAPVLDQIKCEYMPYVMGMRVNQKLKIKNSDAFMHNVHATPKLNTEFNFAQPVENQVNEKSFDKPEVPVRFKCDVHPWMFAYVGVFEHPFYAVTGKDGTFKISGLPNGKYTLEAYHVKTHTAAGVGETQEVTLDGDKKVDFTIEVK